jgi:hypothetical protein
VEHLHDVVAIFGSNADDETPELWLAIKLGSKANGKIRVQYLEEVSAEPGMYILMKQSGMHTPAEVERTFNGVSFIDTRAGKTVSTRTKSPFDSVVIADLKALCANNQSDL